ncbi:MAG: DUF4214 domain-containing protein [Paracoccaceae bacterium]
MPPSFREYLLMSVDAYDNRIAAQDPTAIAIADPAVEEIFPRWEVSAPEGEGIPRNASRTAGNGFEANIYTDEAAGEVVVAFRGTEFGFFLDAVDDGDFDLIDEANLDRDIQTLFGYYQDGGATLQAEIDREGGLVPYIEETFGVGETEAEIIVAVLDLIDGDPFGGGLDPLIEEGEAVLRSQVQLALNVTLQAAADNPGKTVTVTGHSLGGAIAAAVSAGLGVPAVTFDPAPYASDGLLDYARSEAAVQQGQVPGVDTAAAGWDAGASPQQTAADLVDRYLLEGSFVPGIYFSADPNDLPEGAGTVTVLDIPGADQDPFTLHFVDLILLAFDSEERASDARPSFARLAEPLPTLLAQMDNGDLVSPIDESSASFFRALTIEDAFYALFADLMTLVAAEAADLDPDNRYPELTEALERDLIDASLQTVGQIMTALEFETLPTVADVYGDPRGGPEADFIVGRFGRAEVVTPGLARDYIATGGGARDTVFGNVQQLDQDFIHDFEPGDRIVVSGASFGADGLTVTPGAISALAIDTTGDGAAEAVIEIRGSFARADFTVEPDPDGTAIRFTDDTLAVPILLVDVEQIVLLYEATLDRSPEDSGLNYWVDQRAAGLGETALAEAFLFAPEFEAKTGPVDSLTDVELIDAFYLNVLGRPGDAGGVDFWTGKLGDGASRPDVLLAFSGSPENVAQVAAVETIAQDENGDWSVA